MLAPGLSLSIGKPFALPSSSTIPNRDSTIALLQKSGATSLMTVPSILEDLWRESDHRGIAALQPLDFVAVGGGPMKQSVAEALSAEGVRLLNHCGTTEIGALAPIFNPGPEYDWRYFVVRKDLGLRFEDVPESDGYKQLIGRPPAWEKDFVVQDFLRPNPKAPEEQFQLVGRADDLIVLGNGEKVRPTKLEAIVSEDTNVRDCITFGEGREHLGLLIEADTNSSLDTASVAEDVWPVLEKANEHIDSHGKISKDMLLVTDPSTNPLPRTAKGSLARKEIFQSFEAEINEVYERTSETQIDPMPDPADTEGLTEYLRQAVYEALQLPLDKRMLGLADDLFEFGMNSLQATRLSSRLAASMKNNSGTGVSRAAINRNFVYSHPTISLMREALISYNAQSDSKTLPSRTKVMLSAVDKYSQIIEAMPIVNGVQHRKSEDEGGKTKTVLLTGSTGSLGSNILAKLAQDPDVVKIYCFNRVQKSAESQQERQSRSFQKAGISIAPSAWSKIQLLEAVPQQPQFGLDRETYESLKRVSHIIHNAWPMDFNRTLSSFDAQFQYLTTIIQLAHHTNSNRPVRLLFTSSIAAVANYNTDSSEIALVPETPMDDPAVTAPFGYPEAKWVCERILQRAGEKYPTKLEPMIVRVGQLTGSTNGKGWATTEHLPSLFKSSVTLGALPDIPGVSQP